MSALTVDVDWDLGGGDLYLADAADDFTAGETTLPVNTPPSPVFGQAEYLGALLALMPRGLVWPKDPDATQSLVLRGIAASLARVTAAALGLLPDSFPATAFDLLGEWEETLGLPDPCAGPAPTLQIRQAQVVARFAGLGGQSVPYFVGVAALLGYPITITEFTSPGDPHHWQVNAPTISNIYFRAGSSGAGEPLVIAGNDVLECVFRELKPAHTSISFVYG